MDLNRVATLLHIAEKALQHGPKLRAIYDAAMKELNEIAEAAAPKPTTVYVPEAAPLPKLPETADADA